jgi:hypothetical protein
MPHKTIWVNEQIDPGGLIYACIACMNEDAAHDCHQNWIDNLTDEQKRNGWVASLRIVDSWDDVPVNSLKLSF